LFEVAADNHQQRYFRQLLPFASAVRLFPLALGLTKPYLRGLGASFVGIRLKNPNAYLKDYPAWRKRSLSATSRM
jgi:hypothetical protein